MHSCLPFRQFFLPRKKSLNEKHTKVSFIYMCSDKGGNAVIFTVREQKSKKKNHQKLTCSEEREERGAVAVSRQCGHPEAPMAEKLLPVNTDPSRIILIYKPLPPQEEGCSGWRLQSPQPSHHQSRVPFLGVQGAPSVKQAQAIVATKAP